MPTPQNTPPPHPQIDAADPERPFLFGVKVQADNQYEVTRCEPAVGDIPQLLAALNASQDFGVFVKAVRRAWVRQVRGG